MSRVTIEDVFRYRHPRKPLGDGIVFVFTSCTRATLFHVGFGTLWLVNKLNDDLRLYYGQVQLNF